MEFISVVNKYHLLSEGYVYSYFPVYVVYSHASDLTRDFTSLTFWIMVLESLLGNDDISIAQLVDIIHPVMRIYKSVKYLILALLKYIIFINSYLYGLHN